MDMLEAIKKQISEINSQMDILQSQLEEYEKAQKEVISSFLDEYFEGLQKSDFFKNCKMKKSKAKDCISFKFKKEDYHKYRSVSNLNSEIANVIGKTKMKVARVEYNGFNEIKKFDIIFCDAFIMKISGMPLIKDLIRGIKTL